MKKFLTQARMWTCMLTLISGELFSSENSDYLYGTYFEADALETDAPLYGRLHEYAYPTPTASARTSATSFPEAEYYSSYVEPNPVDVSAQDSEEENNEPIYESLGLTDVQQKAHAFDLKIQAITGTPQTAPAHKHRHKTETTQTAHPKSHNKSQCDPERVDLSGTPSKAPALPPARRALKPVEKK